MRPIFTIHAGEYLVASHIENKFKGLNVWVPSKDIGLDLLVTNSSNSKSKSIQVKFSKDHILTASSPDAALQLSCWGWWTLYPDKLKKSTADLWIFVVMGIHSKKIQYIVVSPKELFEAFLPLYGSKKIWQVYLMVTKNNKCVATRTIPTTDDKKDFSRWLNNWGHLKELN